MQDYSEYLNKPGMLDFIESEWLKHRYIHREQARIIEGVCCDEDKFWSLLEVGCSTGNMAYCLDDMHIDYNGIDKSEESIRIAKKKNPEKSKTFMVADIRDLKVKGRYDVICAFAFLKHFGLHEWKEIFQNLASIGDYLIFDMPVGETKDDGTEFHHVWMSLEEIKENINMVGFELIEIMNENSVEPVFICKRKI